MLHVHRSDDTTALVGALAEVLASPLADPLIPEVVAVPTRGIERWIAQELALHLGASPNGADGIAANIEFPLVRHLVLRALAATPAAASVERWSEDRFVWPVLAAIDESLHASWMRVVARFVLEGGGTPVESRRMEAALRISRLFTSYDRERPDLIRTWAQGSDVGADGAPLEEVWSWQPRLWRQVRKTIGCPSPGECLPESLACLATGDTTIPLPPRVCAYGLTALPLGHLQVLAALGRCREAHLFVLHPSPSLWDRLAAEVAVQPGQPPARAEDPSTPLVENPLLASWGRDTRELQMLLTAGGAPSGILHSRSPHEPQSLLHRLQGDVRSNRRPPGPPADPQEDARPPLETDDRSVQIHACHGPGRQVEVLRDAVLHLLNDDPTLEPRDILVMCPDVEAYAPLLEAAFQPDRPAADDAPLREESGIPDVRLRVADRSPTAGNPLAGVLVAVLALAQSRLTAGAVLDFAALGPVRCRFGLDDELLAVMAGLVDDAQISWGADPSHRAGHRLAGRGERTWEEGLGRILAGVMVEDRAVGLTGSVLPLAGVEGDQIEAAGRLAELVSRVAAASASMQGLLTASEWRSRLHEAVSALAEPEPGAGWQRGALGEQIDRLFDGAPDDGIRLSLAEVHLLASPLAEARATWVDHRTGDLTVCGLVPMRSVAHRAICLLGMDDGVFPRSLGDDGDDVLALAPRVGSRERNGEDRQLLLDALMAARDNLIITFSGRDERTNADRPPAVPIAELIDVIDATDRAPHPDRNTARKRWVEEHHLQPFDPGNFPAAEGARAQRGFDRRMLAAARVLRSAPGRPPPPIAPLPPLAPGPVTLSDLQRFLDHPVRAFVNKRLDIRYQDEPEPRDDTLPVELGALQEWQIGQRFLDGALAGHPREDLVEAERGRGTLPPENLGRRLLSAIEGTADAILVAATDLCVALPAAASRQVELSLPRGWQLVGSVGGLTGHTMATVQYARVRPRHLAAAYLRLVALTAAYPEEPWQSVLVGRHPKLAKVVHTEVLGPVDAHTAVARLEQLVALYETGMLAPLPLTMATSYEYMMAKEAEAGLRKARPIWEESWGGPAEAADPHHRLAFGSEISFEELLAVSLPPGVLPGAPDARSCFEALARFLWEPILEVCRSRQ